MKGLGLRTAARKLAHELCAPFQNRAIILLYHRIFQSPSDPFSICISPEVFEEQLRYLRQNFEILKLSELVRLLSHKLNLPHRAVVLTFDDGYGDNFRNARPLLDKYHIPATFFVATGSIGIAREFWWDRLERLFFQEETIPNEFLSVWADLKERGQGARELALEELESTLNVQDLSPRPEYCPMSADEIRQLAAHRLFDIGAHTKSHATLSLLDIDAQRNEIRESKKFLEDILGRAVSLFAYPFGEQSDYSSETVNLIKELGFSGACSAFSSFVHRGSNLFELPRFHVNALRGEAFAASLNRVFRQG